MSEANKKAFFQVGGSEKGGVQTYILEPKWSQNIRWIIMFVPVGNKPGGWEAMPVMKGVLPKTRPFGDRKLIFYEKEMRKTYVMRGLMGDWFVNFFSGIFKKQRYLTVPEALAVTPTDFP